MTPLEAEIKNYPRHWIIEGVDRLGKSTLMNALKHQFGHFTYIHYEKPEKLEKYRAHGVYPPKYDLREYQRESFEAGFKLLSVNVPTIFDRFHLGEYVYSPLYRGYSGEYVFDEIESEYCFQWPGNSDTYRMAGNIADKTRMILLTTSDFSFINDDGDSFDVANQQKEQDLFIEAFHKSMIPNKVIIDVAQNGEFKCPRDILAEATGRPNIIDPVIAEFEARTGREWNELSKRELYND